MGVYQPFLHMLQFALEALLLPAAASSSDLPGADAILGVLTL